MNIPIYLEAKSESVRPGLYLGLFHGRDTVDESPEDWGYNGPLIGPLKFCHTTYGAEIKLEFETPEDHQVYFPKTASSWHSDGSIEYTKNALLSISGDMVVYKDKFYGDWTVFNHPS